jgi:hypothetical protein
MPDLCVDSTVGTDRLRELAVVNHAVSVSLEKR